MTQVDSIVNQLKLNLKESDPHLTKEQIARRNKILNSDNPNFKGYGHKMADIERIAKLIVKTNTGTYEDALKIFKILIRSDVHEEKFIGVYYLNHFKKEFNEETINIFKKQLGKYCDSWSICDSIMLKVVGPFLGKKINQELAIKTIEEWSQSEIMWIRRASMVILLKIIMIQKEFNEDWSEDFVYKVKEEMHNDKEEYIQKAIAWLLKTCSRYNLNAISGYLETNKKRFSRLILRYASEKLPKETRITILK